MLHLELFAFGGIGGAPGMAMLQKLTNSSELLGNLSSANEAAWVHMGTVF